MKKMIAFLLAAILVLGCTACGSKKDEGNDRLAQIKEKGYIPLRSVGHSVDLRSNSALRLLAGSPGGSDADEPEQGSGSCFPCLY